MLEYVLRQLSAEIQSEMPVISRAGGLVQPLKVNDAGKEKLVPVAVNASESNEVVQLSPDSRESGIIWWEAGATRVRQQLAGMSELQNDIRLVCWLNLKRIEPPEPELIQSKILEIALRHYTRIGKSPLVARTVQFGGDVVRDPAIFARWSFAEAETQFLLPPFDFFALQFTVNYYWNTRCEQPPVLKIDPVC
jgi:hypothetical protein